MEMHIESSWMSRLKEELSETYFGELMDFVAGEYAKVSVFPAKDRVFHAFQATSFDRVKVVILGQDPYHGEGQAHGLCFSVESGVKIPPSLRNIFKEIVNDVGGDMPTCGDLSDWAEQGVLLLNATLTVRASEAGSHQKKGWERFTDAVIRKISDEKSGVVFLLWGGYARKKVVLIDSTKHLVLEAPHPSPLSAHGGFFGSGHFSKVNSYLSNQSKTSIKWL